jgi:hypothetical protein
LCIRLVTTNTAWRHWRKPRGCIMNVSARPKGIDEVLTSSQKERADADDAFYGVGRLHRTYPAGGDGRCLVP